MAKQLSFNNELLHKKEILDQANIQLKKEFIGIDTVIDEMLNAVSYWFLFPEMMDKPVVVNLWGLTGVGKTSLIQRLAELIAFQEKFYHFDLGEPIEWQNSIKDKLSIITKNATCYPIIIALDEFQYARTIDESGKEKDKSGTRIIWQLLDSGKFYGSRYTSDEEEIYTSIHQLKYVLLEGVIVKKGKVINKIDLFIEEMSSRDERLKFKNNKTQSIKQDIRFVSMDTCQVIYSIAKNKFASVFDVRNVLDLLDGRQTIHFLEEILESANSPKIIDCSKALIFVLGNLDDAYKMSNDYNPDMNADEFHEQSLKINITQIKKVLRDRFKNEQISRLGNLHIIYPAFNCESFIKIIKLELQKLKDKIWLLQKVKINFDESIIDLIYREGVFPTQGTRPIFTTINQIISSKFGKAFSELIIKDLKVTEIIFKSIDDIIIIEYYHRKRIIHSIIEKQILQLEKLRKNRNDDMQAITAVHESGHAVIAMILLKSVPEIIYSVTADAESEGFVFTKLKWKYISKKEIIKRIALFLGGFAAEKLIFGDENITAGAEGDILQATNLATSMLKSYGMGSLPASINVKHHEKNNFIHDVDNLINNESQNLISDGLAIALNILNEQHELLLKMADYLSDNRFMKKKMAREMLVKYAKSFSEDEIIENGDILFYRNHLKEKVKELKTNQKTMSELDVNSVEFSLNKTS